MDVGRAFRAVFEDPQWVGKLALAFLFSILVVTGPAVVGFWMRYLRNVAEGREQLPEWSEFGRYWVRGLLVVLAAIVYVIVGLLLLIIGIIPALITLQAAVVEYAMTERAGSLFALRTVWRRITTTTSFWLALAITILLGFVEGAITGPLTRSGSTAAVFIGGVIGLLIGLYVSSVQYNLYGQYAREAYRIVPAPPMVQPPGACPSPPPPPSGGYPPPAPTGR